nr:MAG TPA: hypothetical protein [Caudoviricetes sp.]
MNLKRDFIILLLLLTINTIQNKPILYHIILLLSLLSYLSIYKEKGQDKITLSCPNIFYTKIG